MITKGVLIGDSIVSNIFNDAHNVLEAGGSTVTKLAVAGAIVSDQLAVWQASSVRGNSSYDWGFAMIGINNALAGNSAASYLATLDTLLADIHTNNPGMHLFLDIMDPCKTRLDATGGDRYGLWQSYNAGLLARGAIRTISDLMNDGADSLKSIYFQAGDNGLHPNTQGNIDSATALRALVNAQFPDPPPDPPPPFAPNYWQRPYRRGAW